MVTQALSSLGLDTPTPGPGSGAPAGSGGGPGGDDLIDGEAAAQPGDRPAPATPSVWAQMTGLDPTDHRGLDVQSGGWRPQPVGFATPQTPDRQPQAWQPGTLLGADPRTGLSGLADATRAVMTAAHTSHGFPPARLPGPAGGSALALAGGSSGPGPGGGPGGGWRGDVPATGHHDQPGGAILTGDGADLDGAHAAAAHHERMSWLAAAHGFHDPPSPNPASTDPDAGSGSGGAGGQAWLTGDGMAVPTRDGGTLTLTPTARSPHARTTPDLAQGRYLIHIENAQAPGSYQFQLDMPAGAHATENTTGGVDILSAGGDTLQTIAAPWARDAHGRNLPTRFQVSRGPDSGTVLTQHVAFDEATAFPVLADPDTAATASGGGAEGGGTDGAGEAGGTGGGEGGEPAGGGESDGETGVGDGADGAEDAAGDGANAEAGTEDAGVEGAGADPAGAGENTDAPAATTPTDTDTETNNAATGPDDASDGQTEAETPPPAGGQQDPHTVPSTVDGQPVTISLTGTGTSLEDPPPLAGGEQDPPPVVEPAGGRPDSSPGCFLGGICKPPNSGGPHDPLPGQGPQVPPPPAGGQQDPPPVVEPAGGRPDSSPGCFLGGICKPPNSGGPHDPLPGQGPQPDQPSLPGGPPAPERPLPEPPKGASPKDVRVWWNGLGKDDQDRVQNEHPDWVRNLDGIPSDVRAEANRAAIDQRILDDGGRAEEIRKQLGRLPGGPGSEAERRRLQAELTKLEERIGGMTAVKERLDKGGLLLGFEPDAGNGRVIVATGDPDTAGNIITFVPGLGADLASVGGDLEKTAKIVEAAVRADRKQVTVGVTWVGYDAPQSYYDAGFDSYADDAAPRLRAFQEGLRVTHTGPTPSRNTVVGYSYGSTVVGHTARDGTLDADAVVFVASPGVGVNQATELKGLPDGTKIYSTTADGDEIRWVSDTHGLSPSNPWFGAIVFRADPNGGHSQYWTDLDGRQNPALESFGRIAVGQEPAS